MAERSFFSWFTNNWLAKIICLIISIVFFLIFRTTSLSTRKINVTINAVHTEKYIPVNSYVKNLTVEIRGEPEKILNITDRDIKAFIDLSECKGEGESEMTVHVQLSPAMQLLDPIEVSTSLDKVKIVAEKRVSADVKVDLQLIGSVAGGYRLVSSTAKPDFIHISGPQSVIDNMDGHLHIDYDITGQRYSFSNNVEIMDFLHSESNIAVISPGVLEISAKIEPIILRETYKNVLISFAALADKFTLKQLTAVDLILEGAKETVEDFSIDNAQIVADCSSITDSGEFDLPVKVILPEGISVYSPRLPSVKVKIE